MSQLPVSVGKEEYHDGTNWFSLASENWVLNTINNISPCLVTTTNNLVATYSNGSSGVGATLTNSGAQVALVIDQLSLTVGNRVLVKDQTSAFQNGIYTVTNIGSVTTNWVLTRSTDYDSAAQIIRGGVINIINGTANSVTSYMQTSIVTTLGTDNIVFARLAKSGLDSIVGTLNQITVTVTNNVATISITNNPVLPGTGSVTIPIGTTAQRPATPTAGMLRLNTSL
jgi:hypothetical protein